MSEPAKTFPAIVPSPPAATIAFPWDDAAAADPVAALAAARDELGDALDARELVTTFGHGAHRCPAQRFSLSAIARAVGQPFATFDLQPRFASLRAIPSQIGGVARAADPCPVDYVRKRTATVPAIVQDRG